eukprot:142329_1
MKFFKSHRWWRYCNYAIAICITLQFFYSIKSVYFKSGKLIYSSLDEYDTMKIENQCNIDLNDVIQFGSFWAVPLYYVKHGYNKSDAILSIATMCDISRLGSTKQMAKNFNGPISISIYIESLETELKNQKICTKIKKYFQNINNKYNIYISILYPNYQTQYYKSLKISSIDTPFGAQVPINALRNLAVFSCDTQYVSVLDAELVYMSTTINLINDHQYRLTDRNDTIWIIPSFEWTSHNFERRTFSKNDLFKQINLNHIQIFHGEISDAQICTNYSKWYNTTNNYKIDYCHHMYEPWIILKTEYAKNKYKWNNDYIGRGCNKVQQFAWLAYNCLQLEVVHDMFIIHKYSKPHEDLGHFQKVMSQKYKQHFINDYCNCNANTCWPENVCKHHNFKKFNQVNGCTNKTNTFALHSKHQMSMSLIFTRWNDSYLQDDTYVPGLHFNLSNWRLQKPQLPISVKNLANYRSKYFYYDPLDKSIIFMCPNEGALTPTSKYPRSELRHKPEFYVDKGYYYQNITLMISNVSSKTIGNISDDYSIVIAQIHGTNGALPLIMIVWFNRNEQLMATTKLNADIDSKTSQHQNTHLIKVPRNTKFTVTIIVNNGLLSVYANSIKYLQQNVSFWYHRNYFKVGNYFHYPTNINMFNYPHFHTDVKLYTLKNIIDYNKIISNTMNNTFPFYIFQIGFSKVATKNFADFFNKNAVPSVHYGIKNGDPLNKIMKIQYYKHEPLLKDLGGTYMFYGDFVAWNPLKENKDEGKDLIYFHEILLREYDDCKFILNIRNINDWIKSRYLHIHNPSGSFRVDHDKKKKGMKSDIDVINYWKHIWYENNCDILNYFKNNNLLDSLLIFDISKDSVDIMVDFFKAFGLYLNGSHWGHKGKTINLIDEKHQIQTHKWNNLIREHPQILYNNDDLDNQTEYDRILDYCNKRI